jgi:serine/threonine protein kinase
MLTTDQVLARGRYRIISNFTQDETGGLYEAYDTVGNSNVVLRETVGSNGGVMTPAQLDEINSAFADEAKTLKEVRHESLLSVQDYFSEIDRHYLVMESVDGYDLTKFLRPDEKSPALGDVMRWSDQVLAVLDYLHSLPHTVIHRDIRPANIRLTSNFKVKVLTSGLNGGDVITPSAGNPADSAVLNYRPLEQLWGGLDGASQKVILNSYDDRSRRILQQPLDARSDIYSVGATLYHVLTRTLPKDALERSIEILDGNSDPLSAPADLDSSIPEEISEVIMKSMELRREHRYDSAAIMRQVLSQHWQRLQSKKTSEPKQRVAPEPLAVAEPTDTVVDLKKATNEDAPKPPAPEKPVEPKAVKVEAPKPVEAVVEPKLSSDDLLLEVESVKLVDDSFEWSVDVSEQPSRADKAVKSYSASHQDIDFNIETAPRSNMKFVAAGAGGLVILVAILGGLFMGGSKPAEQPKAQAPAEIQQPVQQEQAPVSTYGEQNAANTSTDVAPINETVTVEAKSDTKQATKEKKPTPTPAKTEKKKVTVDDLINDN